MQYISCILLFLCSLHLSGQQDFEFQGQQIPPGTKAHFIVNIAYETNETTIPITVFHGVQNGPTLCITAGVHGYEYSTILAEQQLINLIDVNSLKGTVILVQAANVESFLGRSLFVNPKDGKNLNRAFPGSPNGTLTERIADFISTKVIPRCKYFVDARSGDAPEDLIPYSGYYQNDNMPEVSAKGKEMAMNLGFDYVLIFQTTGKDYMKEEEPSLYCSAQAFKLGIPAVDIECGHLGMVEPEYVNQIINGVLNLMASLEMTEQSPRELNEVFLCKTRASHKSEHTKIFYPSKSAGDYITEGMKIGYVTDFFNRKVQDVYSSAEGVIPYILGTPPVNTGETLVSIGNIE